MDDTPKKQKISMHARKEYSLGQLDLEDLAQDPFEQFQKWMNQALAQSISQPDAMSVATVSTDGKPTVRTVLLKGFDEKGFVFYTNYDSQKGRDLSENPHAALLFYWPELERQVTAQGQVDKVSREESESYFKSRPVDSQIAASVSAQSQPIADRQSIDRQFSEFKQKHPNNVPMPDNWGGYRIWPVWIEFWQGRENRLNDRFRYKRRSASDWDIERLQP